MASTCPGQRPRNSPPEDIAPCYNQLLEAGRGWRDMKQFTDLRPVCHRKEERIRAHVILCWPSVPTAHDQRSITM